MKTTSPILIAEVKRVNPKPAWCVKWADPRFDLVFAVGYYDQSIVIYQLQEDKKVIELYKVDMKASVNKCDFAPWGLGLKLVAVSSEGKAVLITRENNEFEEISFTCNNDIATCVSWAPSCSLDNFLNSKKSKTAKAIFAIGGCDKKIGIWENTKSEKDGKQQVNCILSFVAHDSFVRDLSWSNNGFENSLILASGGEDRFLKIWKIELNSEKTLQKLVWQKQFDSPIWKTSFNYGGNLLAISYNNTQDLNMVEVYSEKEKDKWEQISESKNQN